MNFNCTFLESHDVRFYSNLCLLNDTVVTSSNDIVTIITTESEVSTARVQSEPDEEDGKIISDGLRYFFEVMNFCIVAGIISFIGSIANAINIIIFIKQGFTDNVNISLLGLALSDLGALLTLFWMSICFNPWFIKSGINFKSVKVQYLTAGWPHVCFARITSWITAFVTFERCLCITLPLKVKRIITPRRTIFVILAIFIVMIASVCPVYYAISLGPVYDEVLNTTLISLVYKKNGADIENVSFSITVFAQLSSFVAVIVCTITLVQSLIRKTRWRKTSTVTESIPQRDKRVVKMIILVAFIFIMCFLPSAVNLIIMLLTPEYSIVGKYQNLFQVGWSFLNVLEATNSSVNIIVYYRMSTRYRLVFRKMFRLPLDTNQSYIMRGDGQDMSTSGQI